MAEQTPETLAERMGIEEGSSSPAEPAVEERTATTYVLLVGDGTDGTGGQGWTEVGEIQAASREAAWAIAEEHYSETVVPQVEGDLIYAQLVPTRFFRKITVGIDRPEPRVQVQGL